MRRPFVLLTLVVVIAAVPAVPEGAVRCSKRVSFGPKWPGTAYVLGAARSDTILAGRGPVEYVTGDGHFGRGADRAIYGQVFLVARIGAAASASLPPSVGNAVVVPWDYGADCRPTPWTRSARWLPVGERGVVTGALRETQHWVDGLPTLDVHMPEAQPYPQSMPKAASADSALTADELLTLMEMLPEAEPFEAEPREVIVRFRDWIQANPAIARRWPANEVVKDLHYRAEAALLRKTVPPIAGTFRFTLAQPGRDSAVLFVRTYPRATTWWRRPGPPPVPLVNIRDPDAYYVLVATAPSESELPTGDSDRAMDREGYIGLVHEPRTLPDGSREWDGRVEVRLLDQTRLARPGVTQRGESSAAQGTFVMDPQGRVRAEMTIGHTAGHPVILRGERISTVSIDSKWF